jgi:uncharacterized membrane protein YgcG
MRPCLLLALATLALAADLPKSVGYVNDFAGRLSLSERQALESRLRDYERATSNEVALAIVESLDGDSIDEYANRLFKSWGVGKKERNNGVLLLWAPAERKVRVEVGVGLEGAIPNATAAQIVRTVTTLFRQEEYVRGLNAGVDAIVARLDADGPRYGDPAAPPAAEVPVASRSNENLLLIAAAVLAGSIALIVVLWRRGRTRQLAAAMPKDLARATASLAEGETTRKSAVSALDKLRQEAPPEVWEEFPAVVANAGTELSELQGELASIRAMPQQELGELSRAHRGLKRWNAGFAEVHERLTAVDGRLDSFHYCREHAQLMMNELRETLQRRGQESGWGSPAKLVQAAGDTYALAVKAAAANPVNWLMVYDLLVDTQECLQCADDPGGFRRSSRTRIWMADDVNSPALEMMMMQPGWNSSSGVDTSGVADSSSFGGGDSGGGGGDFGGGDSGGGGSSSDY